MIGGDPVGLPGLAALMVGGLAFMLAVIAARLRARSADGGRQRRSGRSVIGMAVQGTACFFAAIGTSDRFLDPLSTLALAEAAAVAALMAAAVAVFVWASRTMGRNWSLVARTRSDHELVTTGPFAHVQHPIYSAIALVLIAISIATGHVERLLICLPLYAFGTWQRTMEEERLLREAFGAAHVRYAARVRRFVPGLV